MSHGDETSHVGVGEESPITVETTPEHAGTPHSPSSEHKLRIDTNTEDKRHHKQSSLASLAVVEDLAAAEEPTSESQLSSPSGSADFKSPELQDVALEELSLDEVTVKKLQPLSIEHGDVSKAEEGEGGSLATAKPRLEDEDDLGLTSNTASFTSSLSLDSLLSPVKESNSIFENAQKEAETVEEEEEEDLGTSPHTETSVSPTTNLDDLFSPSKDSEFKFSTRGSVTASDFTDDEARFSTVLLSSARQSLDPAHAFSSLGTALSENPNETIAELPEEVHEEGEEAEAITHDERRDTIDGNEIVRMVHQNRVHKKTASTSTIVSANNVPFILARLETEEGARRSSQDGKQMLQEEFDRKHDSQESRTTEASVDWSK